MSKGVVRRLRSWLRYEVFGSDTGGIILAFLIAAAVVGLICYAENQRALRKTTPVIATITAFAPSLSTTRPSFGGVYARDAAGLVGAASIRPSQIIGCKVGDLIRAERVGSSLVLKPEPCPIARGPASVHQGF
jgi:hypothetical protein